MQVMVKLSTRQAIGESVHSQNALPEAIRARAQSLKLNLQRLHPNVNDRELASYYVAETSDPSIAQAAVQSLLREPGIDAAYVKPADEMP